MGVRVQDASEIESEGYKLPLTPQGEFTFKHINQPDTPNVSASTLKTQWDTPANELKVTINNLIADLEKNTVTSGAQQIGSLLIANIDGTTIHAQLLSLRDKLKSIDDGASGADFINATAITGLTGGTVQALLEALKNYADSVGVALTDALAAHKTSSDHDGRYFTENELNNGQLDNRYFTETELQAIADGSSGADKIGATQVSPGSGTTVQSIIEWLYLQITNATAGSIPDGSLTDAKLSNDPAGIKARVAKNLVDITQRGINVKSAPYNAVGDGVADDTIAIRNAVAASTLGDVIFFPKGSYKITDEIVIDRAITIKGERIFSGGTTIYTTANKPIFRVAWPHVTIKGLAMIGSNDPAKTLQEGIYVSNVNNINIIDCYFQDLYNGIHINEVVFYSTIENCRWYSAVNALIWCDGVAANGYQITINHCVASISSSKYGFYFANAGTVTIDDLEMSPTGATNGAIVFASLAAGAGIQQITHSRLEGSIFAGLHLIGSAANPIKYIFVSNTYIAGDPAIKVDYCTEVYFDNCYFTGSSGGGAGKNAFSALHQADYVHFTNCEFQVTDIALTADPLCTSISFSIVNPVFAGNFPFIALSFLTYSKVKRIHVIGGLIGSNANPVQLSGYTADKVRVNVAGVKIKYDWVPLILFNNWVNFGGGYSTAARMQDDSGMVHWKGFIKSGLTASGTIIFDTPAGMRSSENLVFNCLSNNAGTAVHFALEMQSTGGVNIGAIAAGNTWLCLDGISYMAEQ